MRTVLQILTGLDDDTKLGRYISWDDYYRCVYAHTHTGQGKRERNVTVQEREKRYGARVQKRGQKLDAFMISHLSSLCAPSVFKFSANQRALAHVLLKYCWLQIVVI
jgi:hypothetical protein